MHNIDINNKKDLEKKFADNFGSPYFPILADIYLNEGDFRRAKLVCETGLNYDSENSFGHFILAKIYLAEDKPQNAEKKLKLVVKKNPANFNALRMLIRLEFQLNRSTNTIIKYVKTILKYIPEDPECQHWLNDLEKNTKTNYTNNIPAKPNTKKSQIKNTPTETTYNLEKSMATFTMVNVLKSQKHYNQALAVLDLLEKNNSDNERIDSERIIIESLISEHNS